MEINVTALRALFEPFDVSHLIRLWIALAFFTLLWGVLVSVSGGYTTTRQFWKVYTLVLCVLFALSGTGFLLFQLDPLLLLLGLLALAFIVQGDLGISDQETTDEWWGFRLYRRTRRVHLGKEQEKE